MSEPTDQIVIFHVGVAPTAAWLLQRQLSASARRLASAGYRVLDRRPLVDALDAGAEALEKLIDSAFASPRTHTVVASHEGVLGPAYDESGRAGLFPLAGEGIATLAAGLQSRKHRVVLSVMEQAAFLEADFLRLINTGDWQLFPGWLADVDADRLSWRPLYQELLDAFATVDVIEFRDDRSFFVDALAAIGISPDIVDLPPTMPRANLSHQGLQIGLAARPQLTTRGERQAFGGMLIKHFSDLDRPAVQLLTDPQRASLQERYGADWAALHEAVA